MTQDVRSDPGDLAPGDQLAGYQIEEQIGRGGMAVVYRARDLRLDRTVAIKVLAPQIGADEAFRQRFIRESRAAAGVDHPHIVPVFEAGEARGVLFIAMRYVGNGDVRRLLDAEGRLSPARAAAIISQVASALDAAHARGLVHRDVKPGNMLLDHVGRGDHVYLSDFGLSKASLTSATLTATGQFMGTLDYVAPEQIQGHAVDGRADQYSLACAAVEMLTGTPPFQRDDTVALMWAQIEAPPPSLTRIRPELPAAIDRVIATAMAKSPGSRYPTCQDFAAALTAACTASPAAAFGGPSALGPPTALPGARQPAGQSTIGDLTPEGGWSGGPGWRDVPAAGAAGPAVGGLQSQAAETPHVPWAGPVGDYRGSWPSHLTREGVEEPRGHRARNLTLAILAVVVIVVVILLLLHRPAHRRAGTPEPATSATATVLAYFDDINRHDYRAAWNLTTKQETYARFAAGLAGTRQDTVTVQSTKGNVVTARLTATQNTGKVKIYQGTYTVTNGVISSSQVRQTA